VKPKALEAQLYFVGSFPDAFRKTRCQDRCEEQGFKRCTAPKVVVPQKEKPAKPLVLSVPVPVVPVTIRDPEPKLDTTPAAEVQPQVKHTTPIADQPCIPRALRRLRIHGTGQACKDAAQLRKTVKELKQTLVCLLSTLQGKIPEVLQVTHNGEVSVEF